MKKTYKIKGMDCASCASMIELDLEDVGIAGKCNFANCTLEIEENDNFSEEKVKSMLLENGYEIVRS